MLGLGLGSHKASALRSLAVKLLAKLRGRSTYYENNQASKDTIQEIDNYELLDKATILLTPTATSNARVHSVKTYTGDELVTNGSFTGSSTGWTESGTWAYGNNNEVCTGNGANQMLTQAGILTNENIYTYSIDIISSTLSSQEIRVYVGGTDYITHILSGETETISGSAVSAGANLVIRVTDSNTSGELTIDNVSVVDVSSDFIFDRASSATRINSSGLVQDMQSITDPELVLNGNFEEFGDEDANYADGNVTFTNDSGSISTSLGENNYRSQGNGTTNDARPRVALSNSGLSNGKTYKVVYTPTSVTGSSVFDFFENGTRSVNNHDISQPLTFYFTSVSSGLQGFDFDGSQTFSVDYTLSVKEVVGWNLGTGWSIEDGVLQLTGTQTTNANQAVGLVENNIYQVTFTVSETTSGAARVRLGTGTISNDFTDGTHTITLEHTTSNDALRFYADSSGVFNGKIDNVSVKDVTFSTDVDLARINYDSNGDNGHILLEPTSTNLVTYSEDFSQTSFWNANSDILTPVKSTTIAAPDGSYNAWHIVKNGTTAPKVASSVPGSTSTEYTKSIWARTISGTGTAYFGEGHFSGDGVLTTVTTEWQRIEITVTQENFYAVDFRGSSTLTEVLIWGAQMEQLSYATSYIPTLTGSTVTRATETLNGSGNTTLINTTQGTIYLESKLLNTTGTKLFSIGAGTNNADPAVLVGYAGSNMYFDFIDDGSLVDSPDIRSISGINADSYNKMAVSYTSTSVTVFLNGVKKVTKSGVDFTPTNSSGETVSLKALYAGYGTGSKFEGEVKALAVFNEALEDDEIELLTGVTNYSSFGALAAAGGYTII